jgi:hypothetical protein
MSDHQTGIMQVTSGCRNPAISEQLIYGSSRIGLWDRLRQEISHPETGPAPPDDSPPIDDPGIDPGNDPGNDEPVALSFEHVSGFKRYELTNHLGNVLTTVSDRKHYSALNGNTADIISAQDYYPFGSLMPGRNWNSGGYRYGFQGIILRK